MCKKAIILFNIVFSFTPLLFSCKNENKHYIKKAFYDNGNIKSEISYLDSNWDGRAVFFYPNNIIKRMEYFRNGINDSIFEGYDSLGNINVRCLLYYDLAVSKYFFENARLTSYVAIDVTDKPFFTLFYLPSANKVLEGSTLISRNVEMSTYIDSSKDSRTLNYVFYVAQPSGYRYEYSIGIYKVNNLEDTVNCQLTPHKEIIDSFRECKIIKNVLKFSRTFEKSGHYQIICTGKLINIKTDVILQDTLSGNYELGRGK